jgi:hypothetical protein
VHGQPPGGYLERMRHTPRLWARFDRVGLEKTALIIFERRQGLVHWGVGQEHRAAPGAIGSAMRLADHHSVERIG